MSWFSKKSEKPSVEANLILKRLETHHKKIENNVSKYSKCFETFKNVMVFYAVNNPVVDNNILINDTDIVLNKGFIKDCKEFDLKPGQTDHLSDLLKKLDWKPLSIRHLCNCQRVDDGWNGFTRHDTWPCKQGYIKISKN